MNYYVLLKAVQTKNADHFLISQEDMQQLNWLSGGGLVPTSVSGIPVQQAPSGPSRLILKDGTFIPLVRK